MCKDDEVLCKWEEYMEDLYVVKEETRILGMKNEEKVANDEKEQQYVLNGKRQYSY